MNGKVALSPLLIAPILFGTVLISAGVFWPPFRLFTLKAIGRAPYCPWANTLEVPDEQRAQRDFHDQFVRGSKILEKDPAGYELMDTPRGRWWIPTGNEFVLPFNLAEQEREVYGKGDRAVHSGDIVLDCGGNVGTFTRTALRHGAQLVVAFEPAPENIEVYRRNFKDEIAAGKVILIPKGVWDKEDVLLLKRDPHNNAADSFVLLKDGSSAVQAPLTTIDHAVAELKLDRVDYMKLDIEGAEIRALHGAQETLRRFHPRMSIAAEHYPTDGRDIPGAVKSLAPGYEVTCGPCLEMKDGRVQPDVLYFK
jgi:FkbM family methyltransferase